jgi:hypothetical protein
MGAYQMPDLIAGSMLVSRIVPVHAGDQFKGETT